MKKQFKMKKQTIKSLIAILIFNVTFLISAMGQIIYTDVLPDVITTCIVPGTVGTCTSAAYLDLNNDSINDFIFTYYNHIYYTGNPVLVRNNSLKVAPAGGNAVLSSIDSALILHLNDNISNVSNTWNPSANILLCSFHNLPISWTGFWQYATNKYLALKLKVGSNFYYGWVRLDVTISNIGINSFTIKDYAYNSIPNQPILAGQTSTTGIIENNSSNHFSVYPNPATNSVTIKIPSDEGGEIQIINLFGRVVETHNYASLRDGELQIDVSKFPAGMYVVKWSSGENYQTEKFSVIH